MDRVADLSAIRSTPVEIRAALAAGARQLGVDPGRGAVALCAELPRDVALPSEGLLARVPDGRVLGFIRAGEPVPDLGGRVALSAARHDPALLHDALAEAELLLELPDTGDEATYRLLIGVLLRDRRELELLVSGTIEPIVAYDAKHETELLATLETFLAHHGSTTDAAEVMGLHRHTIGYRLARAHEVSGLSPYESAGRERLSLGLKAQQILDAYQRRLTRL